MLTVVLGVATGALVAGLVLVLTPGQAFAGAGDILTNVNNPHNLSSSSSNTVQTVDTTRKCDFCHTPHGASETVIGADIPLWNRTGDTLSKVFTQYGAPQGTIDPGANLDEYVGPQSLACMSCHDGTQTLDDIIQWPSAYPADGDIVFNDVANVITGEALDVNNPLRLGTDIEYDHPVGITNVGVGTDPGLKDPVPGAGYHFGAGEDQVECSSCHNPHMHGTDLAETLPFLRSTMIDNALCAVCHTK
jgi:hypothetical protein